MRAGPRATVADMGTDLSASPGWLCARCGLAAVQVAARIRGAGERDHPGTAEWQMLEEAAQLAPRDQRRSAWFECELQRAAWLEPPTGAALAESIDIIATHHCMVGYAQQAKLCAAAQRLAAGQADAALRLVRAAQADQQHRFGDEPAAEPVHPSGGSEAERDRVIALVLLAAGQADADSVIAVARRRLLGAQEHNVPAEFGDGFLHRHLVHRDLLAMTQAGQ